MSAAFPVDEWLRRSIERIEQQMPDTPSPEHPPGAVAN